jgi:hypothetical protein
MPGRRVATLGAVVGAVVACGGPQRVEENRRSVDHGGLWFADESCARQFAARRVIRDAEVDALAACVAALELQPSERRHPLLDGVVFTYGGGLEVSARYYVMRRSRALAAIGFSAGGRPTISPAALERLRTAGSREPAQNDDDRAAVAATIRTGDHRAFVRLRVCIDEAGAVTSVVPVESSAPEVIDALADVRDWRFRPFVWNGAARGVCAIVERGHPATPAPANDRLSLATEEAPHPAVARLPAGRGETRPSFRGPAWWKVEGHPTLAAAVRFCIDDRGRVFALTLVERSGVAAYDDGVKRLVATWSFAPFLVRGQPARVCSYATFGRSRAAPPRRTLP